MIKLKFLYISFFIISIVISEEKSWTTTTFEYYWNRTFNQIRFREPVIFTPFEARVGYLTYGSENYWDDFFSTNLDSNPIFADSTDNSRDYLASKDSRQLVFVEFDFVRLNIPNIIIKQNFLDIQNGLGYRYIYSGSEPKLPSTWPNIQPDDDENAGVLFFKPKLHDFNFNSSIDFQPFEKLRAYLYHSIGYMFGTLYEYEGGGNYLECKGISEGFGVGLRYVRNFDKYNFNLVYGIEARLHRLFSNTINDPSKISHINKIDIYSKGIMFTIGTIFGGSKSSADHSFLKLINKDYISAEPGFEEYVNSLDRKPRKKLAKKMLEFTKVQVPYQQYNNGLEHQYYGDIDSAIYWFNESSKRANRDLLFEINTHKKDLAIILIDSVETHKAEMTFLMAESIILKAKKLADEYYYVNEMLSDLYIEKGDELANKGNYSKAYIYYNKAQKTYSDSYVKLIEKYYGLTENLIQQASNASNRGNYSLAIESLNFAIDISPEKKNELNPVIDELYSKLSLEESIMIKKTIGDIVSNKKEEIENSKNKKILLGMSSNEVETLIGLPNIKDEINKGDRLYELWTYNTTTRLKKIYFEENLVIKVEQ